ncbi:MAG: hypothetical protein QM589_14325 [Thermomicrobiales bacterium]
MLVEHSLHRTERVPNPCNDLLDRQAAHIELHDALGRFGRNDMLRPDGHSRVAEKSPYPIPRNVEIQAQRLGRFTHDVPGDNRLPCFRSEPSPQVPYRRLVLGRYSSGHGLRRLKLLGKFHQVTV